MRVRKIIPVISSLAFFGILFMSATQVLAATNPKNTITISPITVDQVLQPGSTNNGAMTVANQGSTGYSYKVYAAPYSEHGEAYTPVFTSVSGQPNVAGWFHFSQTNGYLNPGSAITVNYTITVPQNTPAGGYYAAGFVETSTLAQLASKSQVRVDQRVGELFYLQVAGVVIKKGEVASWHAAFLQKTSATASLRLENDGGVHYFSDVSITFRDLFGNPKYTFTTQKAVFPRTIRRIDVTWGNPPHLGLYKVNGTATINGTIQLLNNQYILVISNRYRVIIATTAGAIVLAIFLKGIIRSIRKRPTHYRLRKGEGRSK